MNLQGVARLWVALIFAWGSGDAWAAQKPKYGPEAVPLSQSSEYFQKSPAPDFWALIPYYAKQEGGSSCSVASATMLVNAFRARLMKTLSSDDPLFSEKLLLEKAKNPAWSRAVGKAGGGVTLDQLAPYVERALHAIGFPNAKAQAVHLDDSPQSAETLHQALLANEKSTSDLILLNFNQGTYTGDADVGHIAPLGAYDATRKRALVLDPDREWYEPYWVSEATLLKGMATLDPVSRKNRGFVWVKL